MQEHNSRLGKQSINRKENALLFIKLARFKKQGKYLFTEPLKNRQSAIKFKLPYKLFYAVVLKV